MKLDGIELLRQIFDANKGADGTLVISKTLAGQILDESALDADSKHRRNERGIVIASACAQIRNLFNDGMGSMTRDQHYTINEQLRRIEALAFAGGVPRSNDVVAPSVNPFEMIEARLNRLEKKAGCNYPIQADAL